MKKFVTTLARWLTGVPSSVPAFSAAPVAPDWTDSHANELRRFLDSQAGKDFISKARAMEYHYCREACAGKLDPKMASGISFTLDWVSSLTKISSVSDAQDTHQDRLTADADILKEPAFAQ